MSEQSNPKHTSVCFGLAGCRSPPASAARLANGEWHYCYCAVGGGCSQEHAACIEADVNIDTTDNIAVWWKMLIWRGPRLVVLDWCVVPLTDAEDCTVPMRKYQRLICFHQPPCSPAGLLLLFSRLPSRFVFGRFVTQSCTFSTWVAWQ